MFLMLFFIRRNDCAQLVAQMRMTMSLIMNGMVFFTSAFKGYVDMLRDHHPGVYNRHIVLVEHLLLML